MMAMATKRFRIKGLAQQVWDDQDRVGELAAAQNSHYYWWWRFLRESPECRRYISGRRVEPYASVFRDFGDVRYDDFEWWWFNVGRGLFAQKVALPRVYKMLQDEPANYEGVEKRLFLSIPLAITKKTLLKQITEVLNEEHPGFGLRKLEQATGRRKLYAKQRIRLSTYKPLLDVWTMRKEKPEMSWLEIGLALNLSPGVRVKPGDKKDKKASKERIIQLTAQRLHRRAAALIDFAAKGDFPRFK